MRRSRSTTPTEAPPGQPLPVCSAARRTSFSAIDASTSPAFIIHANNATPGKLGRASCRARECQYVSISVVAVSLKKTKIIQSDDRHQDNLTTQPHSHKYITSHSKTTP